MALILTNAYTWTFLYVMLIALIIHNNQRWSHIMMVIAAGVFCVTLSSVTSELVFKPWFCRLRPIQDVELSGMLDIVDGYSPRGFSFFSSHAANTFSLAVFLSMLVRSRIFSVAMITWSLINCWTRLYLGVHYPSDILVGLLVGGFFGLLVYYVFMRLYMKTTPRLHFISSQYTRSGYSLGDIDFFVNILVITYSVIMIAGIILA